MIQLRTCCSSRAGFVRVPAVGRAERLRDTRREEGRGGRANLQESKCTGSAEGDRDARGRG